MHPPAGVRFSVGSEGDSGGRGRAGLGASPGVPIRKSILGTSLDPSTGQLYRGYNGSGAVLPTDGSFDPVAFLSLVHSKASIEQLKQGRQHLTTQLGNEQGALDLVWYLQFSLFPLTYHFSIALTFPLPHKPHPTPQTSPHLTSPRCSREFAEACPREFRHVYPFGRRH